MCEQFQNELLLIFGLLQASRHKARRLWEHCVYQSIHFSDVSLILCRKNNISERTKKGATYLSESIVQTESIVFSTHMTLFCVHILPWFVPPLLKDEWVPYDYYWVFLGRTRNFWETGVGTVLEMNYIRLSSFRKWESTGRSTSEWATPDRSERLTWKERKGACEYKKISTPPTLFI